MLSHQDFHTVFRGTRDFSKGRERVIPHQNPDNPIKKIMAWVANKTSVCDTTVTGLLLT